MQLQVQKIRKQFQNRTNALTDVSFCVGQGEFVSVIGPSGAGKTTLFRILNGAIRCDGGEIRMDGKRFEAARGRKKERYRSRSERSIRISVWWNIQPACRMY